MIKGILKRLLFMAVIIPCVFIDAISIVTSMVIGTMVCYPLVNDAFWLFDRMPPVSALAYKLVSPNPVLKMGLRIDG